MISRCLHLLLLLLLVKQVLQVLLLLRRAHLCGPSTQDPIRGFCGQHSHFVSLTNDISGRPVQLHSCQQVLQGFILFAEKLQMIGVLG